MEKKYLKTSKGKGDKEVSVVIEKDFSINNIMPIKSEFTEILSKNNTINIELKDIENLDLTSVQLLYSLKKFPGKKIEIQSNIKEDLKNIIINAGLKEIIN